MENPWMQQGYLYHLYRYPFNWADEYNQRILVMTSSTQRGEIERVVRSPAEKKGRNGDLAHWKHKKGNEDMWVLLPQELMVSILARLPFSSFCSVRSVCKKWNVLMTHPDPRLMKTRDPEGTPPLAVMFSVQNCWVCYNPVSNQWHHLPANFGISSNGCDGNSDQGTRVVAGSNGLLLMDPEEADPLVDRNVLWVVNPVNRSERQVVMPLNYRARLLDWHLQVDDKQLSFKYFQIADYRSPTNIGVEVYDSKSDSWSQFFLPTERHPVHGKLEKLVWSMVELDGRLYTLTFHSALEIAAIEVYWQPKSDPGTQWSTLIELPTYNCDNLRVIEIFKVGRLFVKDGSLGLAAIVSWELESEEPDMDSTKGRTKGTTVKIWKLVDNYPKGHDYDCDWKEIASMPQELNDVLWTGLCDPQDLGKINSGWRPQVDIQDEFMWVANPCFGRLDEKDEELDLWFANCGIMCHIPSNSWWQVPNYWDSPNCKLDRSSDNQMLHQLSTSVTPLSQECVRLPNNKCQPFLFSPCMDLIA